MEFEPMPSKRARLRGLVAVAAAIVVGRTRSRIPRRLILRSLGVALAVALFVSVASVGIGLADQGSVLGSNVDYWVTPETQSSSTLPVNVGGPQFGSTHSVTDTLTARPEIAYATPVLVTLANVGHGETTEYALIVGVVSHPNLEIMGVDTAPLTTGDPYYANGTYTGPRTNEAIISSATADLVNASQGDTITIPNRTTGNTPQNFTVTTISAGGSSGIGEFPVAVVHLSELQSLTGSMGGDTADQLLVATTNPGVESDLSGLYDHSRVVTRSDSSIVSVANSDLALALAAAGLLVAVIVGTLFVATTMGLEVATDRQLWATLAALGFNARSRTFLFIGQTVLITAVGGVFGLFVGWGTTIATNAAVGSVFDTTTVAVFSPELAAAGLGLAVLVGLATAPYLIWLIARGSITEALEA
ncbi:ABC transporter permease [Halobacterium salinarum]|uniref:ABC transporter permease n=1 Tax=Halobacterium salinarum TaxID=2242 RepID=UPI002555EE42|nr:ABC transporter permease [Halobacterium salinarum]MDL0119416.1 ABC transporter permease [Halobacterium salinarum]MDL0128288.1 ABC transporter permease [Halobacterium salinarum]